MAMSNTEQNSLFQAMKALNVNQVLLIKSNEVGAQPYVLCQCTPIRQMTASEAAAFAAIYSVTIASP